MRLLFFVLLLANVAIFAWGESGWSGQDEGREPERLGRQLAPEQLRILPPDTPLAPPVPPEIACRRVQWLSAGEAAALRDAAAAQPGWSAAQSPREEPPAYWVAIVDLSSRALAEKKIAELRSLGVSEGEIVEDAELGPYAASLGVFRGRETAEEYLQALGKKGVRSARLARRALPPEQFAVELRAPAAALADKLSELRTLFAQAEFADCPGP
jgi:hypothetical protein